MNSPAWKSKRNEILKRDKYKCSLCNNHSRLQIHHVTYCNFSFESNEDLLTLCETCHKLWHKNEGYTDDNVLWVKIVDYFNSIGIYSYWK